MRYCIGIDLGGTNIAGGIADLDGKLLLTDSIKTGLPCPASDIADRIALLCRLEWGQQVTDFELINRAMAKRREQV